MEYFKIYTYGEYDKKANIKMKARNLVKEKLAIIDDSIDYFFTEFGR